MTNSAIDRIVKRLKKLFGDLKPHTLVKVSFFLSLLDLSIYCKRKEYAKYPLEAVLKLHVYKRVKGLGNNYESLKTYFKNNPEEALELGFLKNIKDQIIFPPKRTYNHYLQNKITEKQKTQLDTIAEHILKTANEHKILLDIELVKKTIKDKKKQTDKAFKEATKLVKKLIYPQINIKIRHNARFTTKDLLDVLVHVAYSHDFTNNGSKTFNELYPETDSPSGDLMLHHFSKLDNTEKIQLMFESIFDLIFNFAKTNYKILNKRKLNIAYDIHKIPYSGNKNDEYVMAGKHERGTSHFFQFLTCSIVVSGRRFCIDATPIHQLDDISKLLDESLARVKKKINIEMAFLDRGFDKPKFINVVKSHKIKFIMPKIRSQTVKRWMRKSEDNKSRIIQNFQIGREKNKATVNLILVDDENGIKRAFITNFHLPEQLTHHLYTWYGKRWGIETKYRQLDHDFKPRTTSKNYNIRLFYFLFSICLYNLWVLVNICVSMTLYGRINDKPLITSKLFAVVLYKIAFEDPPPTT